MGKERNILLHQNTQKEINKDDKTSAFPFKIRMGKTTLQKWTNLAYEIEIEVIIFLRNL